MYVKKKREGRQANLKTQAEKLTDDISDNNTGEQVMEVEGSNPKTDGNSANNFGKQFIGAPDGSTPEAARAADM